MFDILLMKVWFRPLKWSCGGLIWWSKRKWHHNIYLSTNKCELGEICCRFFTSYLIFAFNLFFHLFGWPTV